MKISDKELDDLFNSKLNDLETEPSEMVWNNIADQINITPKKKSIALFLKIAASVIIVVSVGLILLQNNDEPVKKSVHNKLTKAKIEQQKPIKEQIESIKSDEPVLLLSAKNRAVKTVQQHKISNKKRVLVPVYKTTLEVKVIDEMLASNESQNKHDVTTNSLMASKTAVVPDASTRFNVKPDDEEMITETVKPPVLAAKNSTPPIAAKRKGIRSMGDLVNLVMAKIDKRQDKLIEFTNRDDDDESNVTGINLGIISIKKEK